MQVTSSQGSGTAGSRAAIESDVVSEIDTDAVSEIETDAVSEIDTDAVSENETDAVSEIETDAVSETGTNDASEPASDLASDLYALVVFLHKNCNTDLFAAVGALELSLTQIKLLHHLEDQDRELTLKEAADIVLISLPAASRTVDDLVRRGFVARHEDAEDRRMKRVSLTDPGRAIIRRLNAARLSGLEQFTQTLNDTERRKLSGALTKLLERPDVAACRPEGLDL